MRTPTRHFTYEFQFKFIYHQDGAQWFKVIGNDDIWVFINDKLVIDLGGVHFAQSQIVDLNRRGLVDGEAYRLDFFLAERRRPISDLRIETNLLFSLPVPSDFDQEADVDIDDLLAVIDNWGECLTPGWFPPCAGDATGDGNINVDDLLEVIDNWT